MSGCLQPADIPAASTKVAFGSGAAGRVNLIGRPWWFADMQQGAEQDDHAKPDTAGDQPGNALRRAFSSAAAAGGLSGERRRASRLLRQSFHGKDAQRAVLVADLAGF